MTLAPELLAAMTGAIFIAAILYASVGHGGASAYLAIMALFALPGDVMRPTALALNILVASVAAWRFIRAGRFDGALFWPIALGAAPFAFVGGAIRLPEETYRLLLGATLLLAALRLAFAIAPIKSVEVRPPHPAIAVASGAGVGLLAGLTGTGGGIFLSPLMIFLRWARVEQTAGIAALFIVLNSSAGMAGNLTMMRRLPAELPLLLLAAGAGSLIGTWLGVSRYTPLILRRALAAVMVVAGAKLVLA